MIRVDCHEMTLDDQLALASAVSEGLGGRALALVKDESIVMDVISGPFPMVSDVETIIRDFLSKRKDAELYSVERKGDAIIVHTPDPLARSRGRKDTGQLLPDNLQKCPYSSCGFVTPYPEVMHTHVLIHGL